jgi:hypothetical protein
MIPNVMPATIVVDLQDVSPEAAGRRVVAEALRPKDLVIKRGFLRLAQGDDLLGHHSWRGGLLPWLEVRIIDLPQRKRPEIRNLPFKLLLDRAAHPVACVIIDPQEDGSPTDRRCLDSRRHFGDLPGCYAGIIGAGRKQDRRIRNAAVSNFMYRLVDRRAARCAADRQGDRRAEFSPPCRSLALGH